MLESDTLDALLSFHNVGYGQKCNANLVSGVNVYGLTAEIDLPELTEMMYANP